MEFSGIEFDHLMSLNIWGSNYHPGGTSSWAWAPQFWGLHGLFWWSETKGLWSPRSYSNVSSACIFCLPSVRYYLNTIHVLFRDLVLLQPCWIKFPPGSRSLKVQMRPFTCTFFSLVTCIDKWGANHGMLLQPCEFVDSALDVYVGSAVWMH